MNYSLEELQSLGIKHGKNVAIHRSVTFFNPHRITLGSDVRIDCFSMLSANEEICIGNNVHIAAGVYLYGVAGIQIGSFVGLSSRVSIFTASDDYSEGYLTNPTVDARFRKVQLGKVVLEDHAIVGSGSVIMPGVTLGRGAAIGALTFIGRSVEAFKIVGGNPPRNLGERNRERLDGLETEWFTSR